jgi:hypothetical protein
MSTNTALRSGRNGFSIILALAVLGLVVGVVAQWNLPLIAGPRSALIALFVLGFIMCAVGGLSTKTERDGFTWSNPFVIVGMLLGITAVYILYAGLTGRELPYVSGEYGTFTALAVVMVAKFANSRLHNWRLA